MKFFTVLILIFSFSANANWVTETDFDKAKNEEQGATIYNLKKDCVGQCYNLRDCALLNDGKIDLRRCKKGLVDDLVRPNFRPVDNSPVKLNCDNFVDCNSKALDSNGDSNLDDQVCLSDSSQPKWDDFANWPGITGVTGPWFIWCEKPDGTFKQKYVLVPDADGSEAADLADTKLIEDKETRKTKKDERDARLVQCEVNSRFGDFTLSQVTACIRDLTLEQLGVRVKVKDL